MAVDAAVDTRGTLLGSVLRGANQQPRSHRPESGEVHRREPADRIGQFGGRLGRTHRHLRRHRVAHRSDARIRQPGRPQECDLKIRLGLEHAGRRQCAEQLQSIWKRPLEHALDGILHAHAEGLDALRSAKCRAQMAAAVRVLDGAERIAVFRIGPSGGSRHLCFDSAAREWPPAVARSVPTGSMLADQFAFDLLAKGDVLLILAYGRLYREVKAVFAEAKALGLPEQFSLRRRMDTPLAKLADVCVAIPARPSGADGAARRDPGRPGGSGAFCAGRREGRKPLWPRSIISTRLRRA